MGVVNANVPWEGLFGGSIVSSFGSFVRCCFACRRTHVEVRGDNASAVDAGVDTIVGDDLCQCRSECESSQYLCPESFDFEETIRKSRMKCSSS